jgi:hypothetical protein
MTFLASTVVFLFQMISILMIFRKYLHILEICDNNFLPHARTVFYYNELFKNLMTTGRSSIPYRRNVCSYSLSRFSAGFTQSSIQSHRVTYSKGWRD